MLSLAARQPAMAQGSGRRECKTATSGHMTAWHPCLEIEPERSRSETVVSLRWLTGDAMFPNIADAGPASLERMRQATAGATGRPASRYRSTCS